MASIFSMAFLEEMKSEIFTIRGISGTLLIIVLSTIISMTFWSNLRPTGLPDEIELLNRKDSALPAGSEIVSLRIYPIKSCRGIAVEKTRLKKTGLDLDRNWMFIDAESRKFLTIRTDANMTLIDTGYDGSTDELHISIHGKPETKVVIPAHPTSEWLEENTKLGEVEIWEAPTDAWEYGAKINDVFTPFFNKPVALVYKGPTVRNCAVNADPSMYGEEVPHHFADVMSVTIGSEASIADLNRRLTEKGQDGDLTIERFRPNIIIKGNVPWEEDSWKRVQIITINHSLATLRRINLDVVARCARCQVPNVNPTTAEKHPKEPWDTLMKFRRVDQGGVAKYKPCFAMLCVPKGEGEIVVGSKLEVLEVTDKHSYNTAKFSDL